MGDEIKELISILNTTGTNVSQLRHSLERLIMLMNGGEDLSGMLSSVAKVLPTHDLVIKRLTCILIARFIHKAPDVGLLVCNTLRRDCSDPNPSVRSLALRTVLRCFPVVEGMERFLDEGLGDPSPLVRRTAVLGCARLHEKFPEVILDHGYIDRLYSMLREEDPIVVCNCIASLEQILRREGGMVVNRSIALHLLVRSAQMTEWGLIQVLELLLKYEPKSKGETFEIMNTLDPFLDSHNSAVVIHVIGLFLHLLKEETHLRSQVFARVAPRLAMHLNSASNSEVVYLVLRFIRQYLDSFRDQFPALFRGLFCRHCESVQIKILKIEIMALLVPERSSKSVLDELFALCTEGCTEVANAALDAIGRMAELHPGISSSCIRKLLLLPSFEDETTTVRVLLVLQRLDLCKSKVSVDHLVASLRAVPRTVTTTDGKRAWVWFLGRHGHLLPDGPYMLEDVANNEFCCRSSETCEVKEAILICALKMFFVRPAEIQPILGRFAEKCFRDDESTDSIREQVQFYLKLLKGDLNLAKQIILEDK